MSVFCPDCDYSTEESHRFCPNCGTILRTADRCRSCGAKLQTDHRYCSQCGDFTVATTSYDATAPAKESQQIRRQPSIAIAASGFRQRIVTLQARLFGSGTTNNPTIVAWRSASGSVRSLIKQAQNHSTLWHFDEFAGFSNRTRIAIEVAFVMALTLIALYLRIYDLENLPLGFEPNESGLSFDALRVLNGEWIGAWSPVHGGQPTGFSYWTALFFEVGEPNVFWARMASVLPGTALIPVAYLLLRRLFPFRVAVLSVTMLTLSLWFVIASRMGVQMTLAVFMGTTSMWLTLLTCQTRSLSLGVAGGIFLGLSIYSFKAFLPYFAGFWVVVAALTIFSPTHRQSMALRWFLVLSVVVAAPVLYIFAFTGFIETELAKDYYGNADVWDLTRYPTRMFELLMFVQNPISSGTWDGTGGSPLLHTAIFQGLFWIGLVAIIVNINRRPYQWFLIGWLIASSTAILVEGAESRRYLFGTFFLLTVVAIGFNVFVQVLIQNAPRITGIQFAPSINTRRFGLATGIAMIAVFCSYVYVIERNEFNEWSVGPVHWYFEANLFDALDVVDQAEEDYRVVSFNGRTRSDDERIRFLYPDLETIEGASEHGGEGTIRADMVDGNTAFILFGEYMKLIDDLELSFPSYIRIDRYSDELGAPDRNLLYIAYLIRDT